MHTPVSGVDELILLVVDEASLGSRGSVCIGVKHIYYECGRNDIRRIQRAEAFLHEPFWTCHSPGVVQRSKWGGLEKNHGKLPRR